jgi:hypothetical protein
LLRRLLERVGLGKGRRGGRQTHERQRKDERDLSRHINPPAVQRIMTFALILARPNLIDFQTRDR